MLSKKTSQVDSTQLSYQFTSTDDWFSQNISGWEPLISSIKSHRGSPRLLIIGSREGRSAVHLISQLCNTTGSIVCIDHLDLLGTTPGREQYANVQHDLSIVGKNNYRIVAKFSLPALMMLLEEEMLGKGAGYDLIYLDGSSQTDDSDAFLEGELCWRLARKDAVIIFDYCRDNHQSLVNGTKNLRQGIDVFLKLHGGEYERVVGSGFWKDQVVLRKTVDIRISSFAPAKGSIDRVKVEQPTTRFPYILKHFSYPAFTSRFRFMAPLALLCLIWVLVSAFGGGVINVMGDLSGSSGFNKSRSDLQSPWEVFDEGYSGINLTLSVDSTYAMSAAVTIYSAVDHTPGRISIFVIDCGLTEEEKAMLRQSLPRTNNVNLSFLPLPHNSIAKELGHATWSKLDLDSILPMERVLYLDADTFIRGDLTPLWKYNLGDGAIGAIAHVGHPMGHDAIEKHPYFNAGVLLMNLTKVRESSEALRQKGREMRGAKFRDEDVLNIHFKDWVHLSVRWNAQSLGTYARLPSSERSKMEVKEMENPMIVHFTGPMNPSLVQVLNPSIQPPNAKPWGYIGSPGHPFSGEWWKALEKTPYRGYRTSTARRKEIEDRVEMAIDVASKKLRERVQELRRMEDNYYSMSNIHV